QVLDFRLGEKTHENSRFLCRQSKIGNPKSKMGGAFDHRFLARGGWDYGPGAAAGKNLPHWYRGSSGFD
ncbi:MAG TPA: hypothetical protein VI231_00965, partial [Candidatus Binatia bacterium]